MIRVRLASLGLYDFGEPLLSLCPLSQLHVAFAKVEPGGSEGMGVGSL